MFVIYNTPFTFTKFKILIQNVRLSIEKVSSTQDNKFSPAWYEHCYTLIQDTASLIIHEEQKLKDQQILGYDSNVENLIAQYLGFNLFLTLPNRNGENVKVYYNPGYAEDFIELKIKECYLYFLHDEVEVIRKEYNKNCVYIRKSDFEKYKFQIDFNTDSENSFKIEIRHNLVTSLTTSRRSENMDYCGFFSVYGIYR